MRPARSDPAGPPAPTQSPFGFLPTRGRLELNRWHFVIRQAVRCRSRVSILRAMAVSSMTPSVAPRVANGGRFRSISAPRHPTRGIGNSHSYPGIDGRVSVGFALCSDHPNPQLTSGFCFVTLRAVSRESLTRIAHVHKIAVTTCGPIRTFDIALPGPGHPRRQHPLDSLDGSRTRAQLTPPNSAAAAG